MNLIKLVSSFFFVIHTNIEIYIYFFCISNFVKRKWPSWISQIKKTDIIVVVAILDFTKIIKTDITKDYPRNIQGKVVLKWFSGFKEENF